MGNVEESAGSFLPYDKRQLDFLLRCFFFVFILSISLTTENQNNHVSLLRGRWRQASSKRTVDEGSQSGETTAKRGSGT